MSPSRRRSSVLFAASALLLAMVASPVAAQRRPPAARPEHPVIKVAVGDTVSFRVTGKVYDTIDRLRVVRGQGRSSLDRSIQATIGSLQRGSRWIRVTASSATRPGSLLRIEGLSTGRPTVVLPVRLVVTTSATSAYARAPRMLDPSRRTRLSYWATSAPSHFMLGIEDHDRYNEKDHTGYPADPLLNQGEGEKVIGPKGSVEAPYDYVHVISNVSPESPACLSADLVIDGSNLYDCDIYLGNTKLTRLSSSSSQIVVQLPSTAMTGDLRFRRRDNKMWSKPLREDYEVGIGPAAMNFFRENTNSHRWANSYLLGLLCRLIYGSPSGESAAQYKQRLVSTFECWPLNIVGNPIDVTGNGGSTQCVLFRNKEVLIVAFRGTETDNNNADFLTDLDASLYHPVEWGSRRWNSSIKVHAGACKALNLVFDTEEASLLKLIKGKLGTRELWITGHSLGGALAQLLAYRLQKFHGIVPQGVYTYCGFKPGNKDWVKDVKALNADHPGRWQRWVIEGDPVPAYPFDALYRHVGELHAIRSNGSITSQEPPPPAFPISFVKGLFEVHLGYANDLWDALEQNAPTLHDPGKLPAPGPLIAETWGD